MPAAALALADPPPASAAPEPAPAAVVPLPRKRGPSTPEGKARSRRNALKHGLRAKLLPLPLPLAGDDAAHFRELTAGLRRTYRPEDDAEAGLVDAIAVAMWQEIAADRLEAEALAAMAGGEGKPFHGGLLLESPANRATLHTALRYQASASCAVGRVMRLFFQHRRAKRDGLLLAPDDAAADEICTNELPPPKAAPANDDADGREAPPTTAATPQARTNEPTGIRHDLPPLPPGFAAAPEETAPPVEPPPVPANRTNDFPGPAASTAPAHRSDVHPVPPAPAAAQESRVRPSASG
jgi:hypothetical protein